MIAFELVDDHIEYKSGYKYQLVKNASIRIDLSPLKTIDLPFIRYENGILTGLKGYAWDGASGPAIDTKNFMRGSLFHDILYQLMEGGYLSWDYQDMADFILKDICRMDGMNWIRSSYVYFAVNKFGKFWSKNIKDKILKAP